MKAALRLVSLFFAVLLSAVATAQTTITPATHEVGAGTVPYQILVSSNGDWTASTTADWVTLARNCGSQEGNILVTAAANTTGADRTAIVLVNEAVHTLTQRSASAALQELWAFGESYGQLGDNNSLQERRLSPVQIFTSEIRSVSASGAHSLIVKTDGSLWAMGNNDRPNPVLILAGGVQSASAGNQHSLIVKTDGSLWAMGNNEHGQLGDGTTSDRTRPVLIVAGGVQSVAAGAQHSLFVKTDGSLWAMGSNGSGQLGDGTNTSRTIPVQVLASGVQSVAAGLYYSLIVMQDTSLWGMGDNNYGELGGGSSGSYATPFQILPSGVRLVASDRNGA